MNPLLEANDICIQFDGFKALDNFSFSLSQGELLSIIGPNGAGKTTLLNAITGRNVPDRGQIFFLGRNITRLPEYKIARLGVGRKFQTPQVLPHLAVWENLALAAGSRSLALSFSSYKRSPHIMAIIDRIGLKEHSNTLASKLSHGQKQWLEIGTILAQDPKVILLDEPVTGMTKHEIEHTAKLVEDLAVDHGIIVIEHDMNFIRRVAGQVIVMHQGTHLFSGSIEEVQRHHEVKRVYLGEGAYAHR